MKLELTPFQTKAVESLRKNIYIAEKNYEMTKTSQVVSFTAPTGSGKTIIMSSVIESIFFGDENYPEQPEAIFVWLSDSPQLNEQSKLKIDLKADKIRLDQCVTISENSFDSEMLEDGHIYFLNTQKIGKSGNLNSHGDKRTYTIWQTLENTAREKSDHLYFIIDEAHRGMQQGTQAGQATSIMQRFLKGSPMHHLNPMPVVVGMSATIERFNRLVEGTVSTTHKVVVTPEEVRSSGLLKDRIILTYPDNPEKHNDLAMLQASTDEWITKCKHWKVFCTEQHYANVNPVFVIQVCKGSKDKVSETNLDDCLSKIEERCNYHFKENEVVHTFGQTGTITINGLKVPHIEASSIAEDRRIKIVFFKESLSTGWDCPRAETMMSFSHAQDPTYIAQLLGRMVRTPLGQRVMVDESLNDVHLYLPYFNEDAVKTVVDELQATEGADIPVVPDYESYEAPVYVTWGHRTHNYSDDIGSSLFGEDIAADSNGADGNTNLSTGFIRKTELVSQSGFIVPKLSQLQQEKIKKADDTIPLDIPGLLVDRSAVIKAINQMALPTYEVRNTQISSYLISLFALCRFLCQSGLSNMESSVVERDIIGKINKYVEELKKEGKYKDYADKVLEFKLLAKTFDPFGHQIIAKDTVDLYSSDADLDRQLRNAEIRLGSCGISNAYGKVYGDDENLNMYKIDVILYVADDDCMADLNNYAKDTFHTVANKYRVDVSRLDEKYKRQYRLILANGDSVSKQIFALPEEISVRIDEGGKKYTNHLYIDGMKGYATYVLNQWEEGTLEEESKRADFVCWLRNPPRSSWSLCIPYEMDNEFKAAYPDFLVVRLGSKHNYIVDILEPHDPSRKDNLGKAKGFAKYAKENYGIGRIQLIRMAKDGAGKNRFKRLDFADMSVQEKVLKIQTNDELDHLFDTDGFFD